MHPLDAEGAGVAEGHIPGVDTVGDVHDQDAVAVTGCGWVRGGGHGVLEDPVSFAAAVGGAVAAGGEYGDEGEGDAQVSCELLTVHGLAPLS